MTFLDFELRPSWSNSGKWIFLKLLSFITLGLVKTRLFVYQRGLKGTYTARKPLISVGNITLGGTGKTPMVDWLLSFCEKEQLKAAVLTRGYKAERVSDLQILDHQTAVQGNCRQYGDEPWLLFKRHPQTRIYIAPDRLKAASQAQTEADILILDDGMQHLRLNRTLNIVLIDSLSGIGNGKLFPLGPLREPLTSLHRADIIIYTRSDLNSPQALKKKLKRFLKRGTHQFNARFQPETIICPQKSAIHPSSRLVGKNCLLFSGIGNPPSFSLTVERLGGVVIDHLVLGDHASFDENSLQRLREYLKGKAYDYAICTEKDWVKLEEHQLQLPEFWFLKMQLSVDPGFGALISKILNDSNRETEKGA